MKPEELCVTEECQNEGTDDNGRCEECAFDRALYLADKLHDEMREGD
jgi:hypothetical protein